MPVHGFNPRPRVTGDLPGWLNARSACSFNPRPRVTGDRRCLTRCQGTGNQHACANLSANSACGKGAAATVPVSADQRRRSGAANLPGDARSLQVRAMCFCRGRSPAQTSEHERSSRSSAGLATTCRPPQVGSRAVEGRVLGPGEKAAAAFVSTRTTPQSAVVLARKLTMTSNAAGAECRSAASRRRCVAPLGGRPEARKLSGVAGSRRGEASKSNFLTFARPAPLSSRVYLARFPTCVGYHRYMLSIAGTPKPAVARSPLLCGPGSPLGARTCATMATAAHHPCNSCDACQGSADP